MQEACNKAKEGSGRLHLIGLVSDGGVHSHQEHLYEILATAKEIGVPETLVHCVMDGRDTPPKSGSGYLKQLVEKMEGEYTILKIISKPACFAIFHFAIAYRMLSWHCSEGVKDVLVLQVTL